MRSKAVSPPSIVPLRFPLKFTRGHPCVAPTTEVELSCCGGGVAEELLLFYTTDEHRQPDPLADRSGRYTKRYVRPFPIGLPPRGGLVKTVKAVAFDSELKSRSAVVTKTFLVLPEPVRCKKPAVEEGIEGHEPIRPQENEHGLEGQSGLQDPSDRKQSSGDGHEALAPKEPQGVTSGTFGTWIPKGLPEDDGQHGPDEVEEPEEPEEDGFGAPVAFVPSGPMDDGPGVQGGRQVKRRPSMKDESTEIDPWVLKQRTAAQIETATQTQEEAKQHSIHCEGQVRPVVLRSRSMDAPPPPTREPKAEPLPEVVAPPPQKTDVAMQTEVHPDRKCHCSVGVQTMETLQCDARVQTAPEVRVAMADGVVQTEMEDVPEAAGTEEREGRSRRANKICKTSPGRGFWRQQMDHVAAELKTEAYNNCEFRDLIADVRLSGLERVTVHEALDQLVLVATFKVQRMTSVQEDE